MDVPEIAEGFLSVLTRYSGGNDLVADEILAQYNQIYKAKRGLFGSEMSSRNVRNLIPHMWYVRVG